MPAKAGHNGIHAIEGLLLLIFQWNGEGKQLTSYAQRLKCIFCPGTQRHTTIQNNMVELRKLGE